MSPADSLTGNLTVIVIKPKTRPHFQCPLISYCQPYEQMNVSAHSGHDFMFNEKHAANKQTYTRTSRKCFGIKHGIVKANMQTGLKHGAFNEPAFAAWWSFEPSTAPLRQCCLQGTTLTPNPYPLNLHSNPRFGVAARKAPLRVQKIIHRFCLLWVSCNSWIRLHHLCLIVSRLIKTWFYSLSPHVKVAHNAKWGTGLVVTFSMAGNVLYIKYHGSLTKSSTLEWFIYAQKSLKMYLKVDVELYLWLVTWKKTQ